MGQKENSDSTVQKNAEKIILKKLSLMLGVPLKEPEKPIVLKCKLDGFHDSSRPICVEVFARQGKSLAGQKKKIMSDMCKLLLVEKKLGKPCMKVIAVSDTESVLFLQNSWMGVFAQEFGIDILCVDISDAQRSKIKNAQSKQKMTNVEL